MSSLCAGSVVLMTLPLVRKYLWVWCLHAQTGASAVPSFLQGISGQVALEVMENPPRCCSPAYPLIRPLVRPVAYKCHREE